MICIDSPSLKKSLPVLAILLIVAQIDLASAFAWPGSLLTLLHLAAPTDDMCRGVCAGLGASIDVLVLFQLVRIWAKRAWQPDDHAPQS